MPWYKVSILNSLDSIRRDETICRSYERFSFQSKAESLKWEVLHFLPELPSLRNNPTGIYQKAFFFFLLGEVQSSMCAIYRPLQKGQSKPVICRCSVQLRSLRPSWQTTLTRAQAVQPTWSSQSSGENQSWMQRWCGWVNSRIFCFFDYLCSGVSKEPVLDAMAPAKLVELLLEWLHPNPDFQNFQMLKSGFSISMGLAFGVGLIFSSSQTFSVRL